MEKKYQQIYSGADRQQSRDRGIAENSRNGKARPAALVSEVRFLPFNLGRRHPLTIFRQNLLDKVTQNPKTRTAIS